VIQMYLISAKGVWTKRINDHPIFDSIPLPNLL
jgi:hypothetical protein